MTSSTRFVSIALMTLAAVGAAQAAEDASCKKVRFADVGWSDIAATTGLASVVLQSLGYQTSVTMASVPITFSGIKSKQIDAFLGYWRRPTSWAPSTPWPCRSTSTTPA
jgi:glycine betaine/proline transport system substrate-binding protein